MSKTLDKIETTRRGALAIKQNVEMILAQISNICDDLCKIEDEQIITEHELFKIRCREGSKRIGRMKSDKFDPIIKDPKKRK